MLGSVVQVHLSPPRIAEAATSKDVAAFLHLTEAFRRSLRKQTCVDVAGMPPKSDNGSTLCFRGSSMSLRLKVIAVLQSHGEPVTYRELTDLVWATYPEVKQHCLDHYRIEAKARQELRIRFGTFVKDYPQIFSATMSDGRVLVGIAPTQESQIEEIESDEEDAIETESKPSVYWYTFPAYRADSGRYPIKIGRGTNPESRIRAQVTSMPEQPIILGKYEHNDPTALERALHSILILRGKRKVDAPGMEWFMTTPSEIEALIKTVLG
jgi:hypothetical protein